MALSRATMTAVATTVALPYKPIGKVLGFVVLPTVFLAFMGLIVALYIVSAEILKRIF